MQITNDLLSRLLEKRRNTVKCRIIMVILIVV